MCEKLVSFDTLLQPKKNYVSMCLIILNTLKNNKNNLGVTPQKKRGRAFGYIPD